MIETERTFLRPLERKDLKKRVDWINDPIVRETLLFRFPVSFVSAEIWFEKIIHDPTREDFIVVIKDTNEPIGFAGYANIDWYHRKAEIFLAIGNRDYWGKGLGTEIVHELLNYGFNELGLNRQYGFVLDNNPGALKMDLRAGFKQEGVLKQDVMIHGKFHDRIVIGITREEFNSEIIARDNGTKA